MRHEEIVTILSDLSDEARAGDPKWWAPETFEGFLRSTRTDDVPIYLSYPKHFLNAAFVSSSRLKGNVATDLLEWNFGIPSRGGWYWSSDGKNVSAGLSSGIEHSGTQRLEHATPLLYLRRSPSRDSSYIEPNQLLTHTLDLHDDGAGNWVRSNNLGELVPVLRSSNGGGSLLTLKRDALDEYLALSSSSLVRVFDFMRWVGEIGSQDDRTTKIRKPGGTIYYRLVESQMCGGRFVLIRGVDILKADRRAQNRAFQRLTRKAPRKYARFLIWDFRSKRDVEWVADQHKLGNYFGKPGPYGTSPAFFKPELLLQYRAEPERFTVEPDQVVCRGAWSIPYYINEAGQVHAYIIDLAHLPYEEQLRWKAHNESRKGGISKRAYVQDFEGEFSYDYDPLESLREIASEFPTIEYDGRRLVLWRSGEDIQHLGYVVTTSTKDFKDQILSLSKVVVEGLVAKNVNAMSKRMKCRDDDKLASIKQLERLMEALGVDKDTREEIVSPMWEVQGLRSSAAAHRGKVQVSDPRETFRDLLSRCDNALRKLADLVSQGVFAKAVRP